MRWRLVGVKPFFVRFVSGVLVTFLVFGASMAVVGLVANASWSHKEIWLMIAAVGGMGAGLMSIVGWMPSTVWLDSNRLLYKGIIRGGNYHFRECSRIRCEPYKGMLKLSLDMSPEAGWAPQTIVLAAPVKRLNNILFILNASRKFEDSAGLQTDVVPMGTEQP